MPAPNEPPRASVLQMNLDGSQRKVFASGLRNPVGLAFHPTTGELYATVNERDGLGDDLPPDYFTRLLEGDFYGWPYAYLAPQNLDPRLLKDGRSLRPDLAARTKTPDVLFQTHSAALGLAFYGGKTFPEKYRQGAFVAFRGSWNRSRGTGYKIVFIPFNAKGGPRAGTRTSLPASCSIRLDRSLGVGPWACLSYPMAAYCSRKRSTDGSTACGSRAERSSKLLATLAFGRPTACCQLSLCLRLSAHGRPQS